MPLLLGYWMSCSSQEGKGHAKSWSLGGSFVGCYGYSGWSWQAQAVPSHSKSLNWSRFSLQGFTRFSSDSSSSVQVFSKARVDISGTGIPNSICKSRRRGGKGDKPVRKTVKLLCLKTSTSLPLFHNILLGAGLVFTLFSKNTL